MPRTREIVINIEDPDLDGLLRSFNSEAKAPAPRFVWGDGEEINLRLVRPIGGDPDRPYEDAYEASMVARVAVGFGHRPASSGSFLLTIENTQTASNTVTDPIAWNATASEFETIVNAACLTVSLPDVHSVTKSGTDFVINADLGFAITTPVSNLTPECTVTAKQLREANGDLAAVWRVRAAQNGIAYASLSTPYPTLGATVTATSLQTGDDVKPSIQRLTLDPAPIGGSGLLSWGQAEVTEVITTADGESSLTGSKAVILYDADGSQIDVVLTDGTGTLPAVPAGGSQVVVNYTTNDPAAAIATAIALAIDGGSTHTADAVDDVVTITAASNGPRTASIASTSGFSVERLTQGYLFSKTVAWNASEEEMAEVLDDTVEVSKVSPGVIEFTFLENGPRPLITLSTANLITPKGLTGPLSFETIAAQEAFSADPDAEYIEPTLSVEIQYDGEEPKTALLTGCRVYRDIVTTV